MHSDVAPRAARALASVAAVAAAALILAACSSSPVAEEDRSIRLGIPGWQMPVSWDPAGGGVGLWFMSSRPVYESLIKWDIEEGEYVGWLAEEYEISEDGHTMSLTLREDVDFVDGEHMDAEGVVAALNDAFFREGSYWAKGGALSNGTTITATSEYTLDLTAEKPLYAESEMLLELSYLPIASPAAVEDPSRFEDGPVGSGPYLLDEIVPEVSASYSRNPDYRDPDAFDFDTIELKVFDDKIAALNAMKSGQLDAAEMDRSLASEAEASGLVVHTGPSGFVTLDFAGVVVDAEFHPLLSDVRVRQAINYAIDKEEIARQIDGGYGRVSSQPLQPGTNEYVEGGDDRYAYDPELARQLLADAGHADGFVLRFPISAGTDPYRPVIEQNLQDVGITVEWDASTEDVQAARLAQELAGFVWLNIYSNTLYVTAEWILKHPDLVDDDIMQAAEDYKTGSLEEHAGAQPLLSEFVLDQAFYAPVAHPAQFWVTTPGVEMHLTNRPSYFITLDSFTAAE